jgi:hypothetical protein
MVIARMPNGNQSLQEWVLADGVLTAFALQGALATGMGLLICGGLIWKGEALRSAQHMPKAEFKLA